MSEVGRGFGPHPRDMMAHSQTTNIIVFEVLSNLRYFIFIAFFLHNTVDSRYF